MHINFYIKKKMKNKFILSVFAVIFSAIFLFGISFNSQKTSVSQESENYIKLPVIMYHMVLKNPKNNKFIVSEKDFEDDLKYINANGYTTITVNDLIEYTENKKELPKKPILLTFDDGAYNNYLYAFPLAKKYNAKFVFSPIAREADRYSEVKDESPEYAYANWEKIAEMSKSGNVEIQNHTYNMHSAKKPRIGCTKMDGESQEIYKKKLSKDLEKAQNLIYEKTGIKPTAFFYPFGACSKCSEDVIKSLGFKSTFMCESRVNKITKDPNCLFGLGRFLRLPGVPAAKFFSKWEKVK